LIKEQVLQLIRWSFETDQYLKVDKRGLEQLQLKKWWMKKKKQSSDPE